MNLQASKRKQQIPGRTYAKLPQLHSTKVSVVVFICGTDYGMRKRAS
ncbi:hypothetical protein swp_1043 [Shewanella piezotolerans WP3]|uniref:Uncharacterized protein n=1 Tax=Shewanella piezotolerans (strain WP3 / JCM 13877) TaxID=225849 RepID=B8CJ84_SHEPW|nr:hypothetical protein swp_1043 [Shewanella piezotolerans WP3]